MGKAVHGWGEGSSKSRAIYNADAFYINIYTFTWKRAIGWNGVIGLGIHAKGDGIAK